MLFRSLHRYATYHFEVSGIIVASRHFKVICGIPVKCLDATIIPLLRCVHHHDDLSALLGNTIISMLTSSHTFINLLFR